MGALDGIITFETAEYRPCLVNGVKALFHMWSNYCYPVEDSLLRGGHRAGEIKGTVAIVEYEDGTVAEVDPKSIKFVDNKIKDYAFYEINN